jgi:dTDP-4-dehydrorhamnose reductase
MLGTDVCELLATDPAVTLHAACRARVDLRDAAAVRAAIAGCDLVVNTAAWTDVDGAEADPGRAMLDNGEVVGGLAAACRSARAHLLHLSTDYVFDGYATTPYAEDAPTAPINRYGASKLCGERHVLGELPQSGFVVRRDAASDHRHRSGVTIWNSHSDCGIRIAAEFDCGRRACIAEGGPDFAGCGTQYLAGVTWSHLLRF